MSKEKSNKIEETEQLAEKEGIEKPTEQISNRPFSAEHVRAFNEFSHFPIDINNEFSTDIEHWEQVIRSDFDGLHLEAIPEQIQQALERYKKVLYDYYLTETRNTAYAPPAYVVGPANYPVHRLAKARARDQKNYETLQQSKEKLERTINIYIGALLHQQAVATSVSHGNTQVGFEQTIKRNDIVEARFTANNQRFVFPAKVISIAKSSIRVATLSDGVPYPSEKAGREFVLPFGFAKTKSKNNGVFPPST